jgi:hypothetical protein
MPEKVTGFNFLEERDVIVMDDRHPKIIDRLQEPSSSRAIVLCHQNSPVRCSVEGAVAAERLLVLHANDDLICRIKVSLSTGDMERVRELVVAAVCDPLERRKLECRQILIELASEHGHSEDCVPKIKNHLHGAMLDIKSGSVDSCRQHMANCVEYCTKAIEKLRAKCWGTGCPREQTDTVRRGIVRLERVKSAVGAGLDVVPGNALADVFESLLGEIEEIEKDIQCLWKWVL